MVETITTTLQDELEAQHFDEPIRERLSACLPVLEQAITAGSISKQAPSACSANTMGSTLRSGAGSECRRLGRKPLDQFDHELAVRAVAKAVELPGLDGEQSHHHARAERGARRSRPARAGERRRAYQPVRRSAAAGGVVDFGLLATTVGVPVAAEPSAMAH